MKETDKFKNGVMKMSNKIIKKLMHGQTFTLNEDNNLVEILYALSHAMKIAAPKINKDTHTQCVFHIIRLRLIIFHTPKYFRGRNKIE